MSTETTNKKIKIDNGTTFGRTYTDKAIDAKLPTDLIATAKKLSLGVGSTALGNGVNLDGFTYDEATKTLKASVGGSIPIVEGTMDEASSTETAVTINIPQAQTKPFILHIEAIESYILMSVIMGAYLGYLYKGRNEKVAYIFQGADTTIDVTISSSTIPTINGTYDDTQEKITLDTGSDNPFILSVNGLGKFFINVIEGLYSSIISISQDDASVNELTITLL